MGTNSPNIMANSFISCATHNGDGEVLIYGDRRITWAELTPRIFKIANSLIKLGVKKDEKVAFMFHNTPEFFEINNGIQAAGAIPAPMNYRFIPKEVEYQGNHCDAGIMIYDSIWSEAVEAAAPQLENIRHFICKGKSGLGNAIEYEEFVNMGDDTDPKVATEWEDVAVMIYTGGTTGFPKGVMLTYGAHRDLYATMLGYAAVRTLTLDLPRDKHKMLVESLPLPAKGLIGPLLRTKAVKKFLAKPSTLEKMQGNFYEMFSNPDAARKNYKNANKCIYPSMPFFHDAAYANLMMGMMGGGMIFVLIPSVKFDPEFVLETVEKEKIAQMSNVPTGWKKLVDFPDAGKYDLTSLRIATTGGGVCPAALKKEMMGLFPNAMILDAFGQTEMTPVTSFRFDFDPDNIKDRSVGKSIVKAKVVNEEGNELPQGEIGEICYSSSTIMKGYYKDEEKTSEVMKDGWFKSGDLGYIDEAGEIRVVDRKNECINTGGEKVFPLEVEEVIRNHSGVEDVCIIGIPDEEWGSTVRAVVQLKSSQKIEPQEIMDFCRGEIAGYKIPRSVVFTDELPYSPVGKMLREKIREQYGKP